MLEPLRYKTMIVRDKYDEDFFHIYEVRIKAKTNKYEIWTLAGTIFTDQLSTVTGLTSKAMEEIQQEPVEFSPNAELLT